MPYRLLTEFEQLFLGQPYLHRRSTQNDWVSMHLYEDLVALGRSTKLVDRVQSHIRVLTATNKTVGIKARRGDGTFGEVVPHTVPLADPGYLVARGQTATVEIGVEMKVLAKAMIKQMDRVKRDLSDQASEFKRGGANAICVAVVGINHAPFAVGYEGDRVYRTDGKKDRHPIMEAPRAEDILRADAAPHFDEFVVLHYIATNDPPYAFSWLDPTNTNTNYGAALTRISIQYDQRFP